MVDKDVCITAHVYDVVELADGTRFLDICTPATPTMPACLPSSACEKTASTWAS